MTSLLTSEDLTAELAVETRDETRRKYLRDYSLVEPDADTREGSLPYVYASAIADTMVGTHATARILANATLITRSGGKRLDAVLGELGLTRLPAQGARGYVSVTTVTGGAAIYAGRRLEHKPTGLYFECSTTGTYDDDTAVPIVALDTGPQTSLEADAVLQWVDPPPGVGPFAVVLESSNGQGLTGGREEETDEEFALRGIEEQSNPAASGNESDYLKKIEDVAAHGVPVAKGFVYPAWDGTGTIACAFVVKRDRNGGSRIPTAAQLATVHGYIEGIFPGDDHAAMMDVISEPVAVQLRVAWRSKADSYVDLSPWPQSSQGMAITAVTSATEFEVTGTGTAPQVGQTIGIFDLEEQVFRRKKIATVTGSGPWTITCETSNNASDLTYTPTVGQIPSPWSDSLDSLVPAVVDHFDTMGPGEIFDTFVDTGKRQRRIPLPPDWPSQLDNNLITGVRLVAGVSDVEVLSPSLPSAVSTGTPGVAVSMLELGDLAVFED